MDHQNKLKTIKLQLQFLATQNRQRLHTHQKTLQSNYKLIRYLALSTLKSYPIPPSIQQQFIQNIKKNQQEGLLAIKLISLLDVQAQTQLLERQSIQLIKLIDSQIPQTVFTLYAILSNCYRFCLMNNLPIKLQIEGFVNKMVQNIFVKDYQVNRIGLQIINKVYIQRNLLINYIHKKLFYKWQQIYQIMQTFQLRLKIQYYRLLSLMLQFHIHRMVSRHNLSNTTLYNATPIPHLKQFMSQIYSLLDHLHEHLPSSSLIQYMFALISSRRFYKHQVEKYIAKAFIHFKKINPKLEYRKQFNSIYCSFLELSQGLSSQLKITVALFVLQITTTQIKDSFTRFFLTQKCIKLLSCTSILILFQQGWFINILKNQQTKLQILLSIYLRTSIEEQSYYINGKTQLKAMCLDEDSIKLLSRNQQIPVMQTYLMALQQASKQMFQRLLPQIRQKIINNQLKLISKIRLCILILKRDKEYVVQNIDLDIIIQQLSLLLNPKQISQFYLKEISKQSQQIYIDYVDIVSNALELLLLLAFLNYKQKVVNIVLNSIDYHKKIKHNQSINHYILQSIILNLSSFLEIIHNHKPLLPFAFDTSFVTIPFQHHSLLQNLGLILILQQRYKGKLIPNYQLQKQVSPMVLSQNGFMQQQQQISSIMNPIGIRVSILQTKAPFVQLMLSYSTQQLIPTLNVVISHSINCKCQKYITLTKDISKYFTVTVIKLDKTQLFFRFYKQDLCIAKANYEVPSHIFYKQIREKIGFKILERIMKKCYIGKNIYNKRQGIMITWQGKVYLIQKQLIYSFYNEWDIIDIFK